MIFNVNAAAVAALALTMAVHAAPSPVGHVLHDIAGCDNVNDGHGADFVNHRDDGDRSAVIRVSVDDATSNRASDESRRTGTNRVNDESRQTDTNRASDGPRQTDSNRASDESRRIDSDRAGPVDARVLADSNRASDESRRTDSNRANDDSRQTDTNRASDESRRTGSNRAGLVDARDNSRCDDCKPEVSHAGGVLRRGVGPLSQITHVLRVEHLNERCSPEEGARRCGPDCNGIIGGWNHDKSLFDLLFLDKASHGIPSELDILFSQQREDGWEPQFFYGC